MLIKAEKELWWVKGKDEAEEEEARVRSGKTRTMPIEGWQGKRVTVSLTFINSANNDTSHRQ